MDVIEKSRSSIRNVSWMSIGNCPKFWVYGLSALLVEGGYSTKPAYWVVMLLWFKCGLLNSQSGKCGIAAFTTLNMQACETSGPSAEIKSSC